ncbi:MULTISPECIES: DUF4367 domain-containing protein [Clostridiaceae]|uniref:DUF4367 domain-containing protein n=1 Tax=Clostridium facile TaxID=2763035 RepID=A0ABR7IPK7_9CLOT|nr:MULTISPECIES: DUF4367 domain-containing protein [Clostridiaceae]MBC5787074.1 DUF4367 domain-containing protein [Clostridium facile]
MTINERINKIQELNDEMLLMYSIEDFTNSLGDELKNKNDALSEKEKFQLNKEQLNRFRRKLNKEFKKSQPHPKIRWVGRIAVVLSILLMVLLIAVCSVGAFRRAAIDILAGIDNEYGVVHGYSQVIGDIEIYPPEIPEDYTQTNLQISSNNMVTIEYTANESGNQIYFTQQPQESGGVLDMENTDSETIWLDQMEAQLLTKSFDNKTTYSIVFTDNTYIWTLSGTDKDILIQMAKSVQPER